MPTLISPRVIPSYSGGWARNASESMFPSLWVGKVGHWVPALGPTGVTLRDISVFQPHDCVLTNMELAADWVVDELGHALNFDGTDEFAVATHAARSLTHLTYALWIQPGAVADNQALISSTSGPGLLFELDSGALQYFPNTSIASSLSDAITYSAGDKMHIAVTHDLVTANFYKDGLPVGSPAATTAIANNSNTYIGNWRGTDRHFPGRIYEARLYNRALNPWEIRLLYDVPFADLIPADADVGAVIAAAGGIRNPMGGPMVLRNPLGAL